MAKRNYFLQILKLFVDYIFGAGSPKNEKMPPNFAKKKGTILLSLPATV